MSVSILVGAQFGDEGKGKIVDYISAKADMVVRFQGGDNAGHTVVNEFGAFKLHLIPCGIFKPSCITLAGTGMVINPDELLHEISDLEANGINTSNLYISSRAIILMPYHIQLDCLSESSGRTGIGTTKRGIGYAYADKARRNALRFEDLLDLEYCEHRLEMVLPTVNAELVAKEGVPMGKIELLQKLRAWAKLLAPRIVEPVSFVNRAIDNGLEILFEGQLGAMKDIDLGIYPYVTSSNPTAAYAAASSGFPISKITEIIGVLKAFSSAVGSGPFPTEIKGNDADVFRGSGQNIDDEFGARTGRPRQVGWLDLPVLKYAATINGFTSLAVCKIDKLDMFDEIKICTHYSLDGKDIDYMPSAHQLEKVVPVYITVPGWKTETRKIRNFDDLPQNARNYLNIIEKATGVPIKYIGVGPSRDEIIVKSVSK
ncbi:MAG: adenylosuccinate synthase [Christensenellaceae bacterium]|jgi:adenylosuccinate synthase|nr:adenylosuccinate synthase [Christensenellaceae bacterium]